MADCQDHPLKPRKPKENVDPNDDTAESISQDDAASDRQENRPPEDAKQEENGQSNTEKEMQLDDRSRIDREENAQATDNGQFVNGSRMLANTDDKRDENLQAELQQRKNVNSERGQWKDDGTEKPGKKENCQVRKDQIKSDCGNGSAELEHQKAGPDVENPKDEESNPIVLDTHCGTFDIVPTTELSTKVRCPSLVLSY